MRKDPRPFEKYRHFKGHDYQILALAKDASYDRDMVVYQGLYPPYQIYVRELSEFMSDVDKNKYPDAKQKERFALITRTMPFADHSTMATGEDNMASGEDRTEMKRETENITNPDADKVDPALMRFLDAEEIDDKLRVLYDIRDQITPEILTPMEISLGMEVSEEDADKRITMIKHTLLTRQQFEKNRLRN
ncbi:MAG: DUF1653 domain-containing protein [Lachnospiraceae bacterium]|nr:DUF1653 domain-containing protein [Lachnospiraceae bacterium]